jgi:hypothetical protein
MKNKPRNSSASIALFNTTSIKSGAPTFLTEVNPAIRVVFAFTTPPITAL